MLPRVRYFCTIELGNASGSISGIPNCLPFRTCSSFASHLSMSSSISSSSPVPGDQRVFDVWGRLFSWLQLSKETLGLASFMKVSELSIRYKVHPFDPFFFKTNPLVDLHTGLFPQTEIAEFFVGNYTLIMGPHGFSFNVERSMWKGNV